MINSMPGEVAVVNFSNNLRFRNLLIIFSKIEVGSFNLSTVYKPMVKRIADNSFLYIKLYIYSITFFTWSLKTRYTVLPLSAN